MTWRVSRFFLFQLIGGLLGFRVHSLLEPLQGAIAGVVLASVVWILWDLRRGQALLAWLKRHDGQRFEQEWIAALKQNADEASRAEDWLEAQAWSES